MGDAPLSDDIMLRGLRRLLRDVEVSDETTAMGLEEAVIGETSVSRDGVDPLYRGYAVSQLADECSYAEVAYLLINGSLPDRELLADFRCIMMESAWLDPMLVDWIESVPLHSPAMDVLRTAVSMLSHFDPDLETELEQGTRDSIVSRSIRLLAQLPSLLALRVARQNGWETPELDQDLSFAANLYLAVTGKRPDAIQEKALNRLLILHACNGFDGPTLAARTASSCRSDFYSAVLAAMSAVKGGEELGGVRQHLLAITDLTESKNIIEDVRALLAQGPMDGFVSEDQDHRGLFLKYDCQQLSKAEGMECLEATALGVEQAVYGTTGKVPGLRWTSSRLLHYLGLDDEAFGPLLAIARIPGWAAHCREQMRSAERVRPVARYIGPDAKVLEPISERQ